MDTLQNIFFPDTFWRDLFLVMCGIISERLRRRWKTRDRNPFRWDCVDCRENSFGNRFYCSANDVTALDRMILNHKRTVHNPD